MPVQINGTTGITTSKVTFGDATSIETNNAIPKPSQANPNQLLTYNGANWVANNISVGGDLTGSIPNPLVTKIQGIPISNATPANGQVLAYNGSSWTGTPFPKELPTTASAGQLLTYNGSTATWVASAAPSTSNIWGIMGIFNKGIQVFKTPGTYSFTAPPNITSVLVVVVGGGSTGYGTSTGYSGGTSSCSIGGKTVIATGGSPAIVPYINGSGGSVAEVLPDPSVGFSGVGAGIGGQGATINYSSGPLGGASSGDYGQKGGSYGGPGGSTGAGGGGSRGGAAGPGIVSSSTSTGLGGGTSYHARGGESGLTSPRVPFTPAFESYLKAAGQITISAGRGGANGDTNTAIGGGGGGCAAYVINVIPNTQYTNSITVGAGGAGVDFRGGSYPLASQGVDGIVVVFY